MPDLSGKIREKRNERKLTLRELAEKVGVTVGFLSQIERGISEPSVSSLRKIAEALGVPTFYFLMEEPTTSPVVRVNQRRSLKFSESKLVYELLSPDLQRNIEMLIGTIEPEGVSCPAPMAHEGEDCLLVLKGVMQIVMGETSYELYEGDSIYIPEMVPHQILNESNETLIFVCATTPAKF
ncbi:MAG: helix-turn-helix domain-containing protein [Eubacteriales bacterium]